MYERINSVPGVNYSSGQVSYPLLDALNLPTENLNNENLILKNERIRSLGSVCADWLVSQGYIDQDTKERLKSHIDGYLVLPKEDFTNMAGKIALESTRPYLQILEKAGTLSLGSEIEITILREALESAMPALREHLAFAANEETLQVLASFEAAIQHNLSLATNNLVMKEPSPAHILHYEVSPEERYATAIFVDWEDYPRAYQNAPIEWVVVEETCHLSCKMPNSLMAGTTGDFRLALEETLVKRFAEEVLVGTGQSEIVLEGFYGSPAVQSALNLCEGIERKVERDRLRKFFFGGQISEEDLVNIVDEYNRFIADGNRLHFY